MHRLVIAAALLVAVQARAYPWKGIDPGKSGRQDVVAAFGEPAKITTLKDREILAYLGTRTIAGTKQAQFRIDLAQRQVERIDVFPAAKISKELVVGSYGPSCGDEPDASNCYVEKVSEDTRVYFLYEQLGLAVFFDKDGRSVFSFVYVPGKRIEAQGSASAAPEGGGEAPDARDALFFADEDEPDDGQAAGMPGAFGAADSLMDDPLKIGGLFYLRSETGIVAGDTLADTEVGTSAPMLLDLYLDGRPNERLRAMVMGRMIYDPMLLPPPPPAPGEEAAPPAQNPAVSLDQLWVAFDVARQVFVTAGRQRIKWGASKLWNPTDFLTPPRNNPLAPFDDRIGTDMLRINVPLTQLSTNATVLGLVDTLGPAGKPLQFGGAFRAEVVLLGAELSATAVVSQNRRARLGVDFSSPLGPLDVHGELAVRGDSVVPLWREVAGATAETPYEERYERYQPGEGELLMSTSAGVGWTHQISEQKVFSVGLESYFNPSGYRDAAILPWLISQRAYQPFHAGQWYAAALLHYMHRDFTDAFTATGALLANLSDRSYLARLDLSLRLLRDMVAEVFVAVPFGRSAGEFRFQQPSAQIGLGIQFKI